MTKKKWSIDFKNFEEMAEKLDGLGGDLKATADKALQKSHDYVTERLEKDMKPHNKTHKTERSLMKDEKVEWSGNIAEIHVGFNISHGGLPSIFLMYGTPRHAPNHPGQQADKKLYNDVYGSATKRKIQKLQEEIFAEAIKKRMGG